MCLDLIPKGKPKDKEIAIDRNSITSAFSSLVTDDSGDQEIPIQTIKEFITNFIQRLKNSILKALYEFVIENSKVLVSQCESKE